MMRKPKRTISELIYVLPLLWFTGCPSGKPGGAPYSSDNSPPSSQATDTTNTLQSSPLPDATTSNDVIPPSNFTYSFNPATYSLRSSIPNNSPSHGGGAISTFAVSPSLPTGLSLDATTGIISGTPIDLMSAATYVVTGANSAGTVSTNLSIAVSCPSGFETLNIPNGLTALSKIGVDSSFSDPLQFLTAPSRPTNTAGSSQSGSLSPGYYPKGLTVTSNTTFQPGLYYLEGDLLFNGATVSGNGVTLYHQGAGSLVFNGSSVQISAPTNGPLAGIAIWQAGAGPITFNGGNVAIAGAIYAPQANLISTGISAGIEIVSSTTPKDTYPATASIPILGCFKPLANSQLLSSPNYSALPITLSASEITSSPLTYSVTVNPGHGTLSGTAPKLTYLPDPSFVGIDQFTFTATDGRVVSNPATVTIAVVADETRLTGDAKAVVGACTPVTVTVLDQNQYPVSVSVTSNISLASSYQSTSVYADAGCTTLLTSPYQIPVAAGTGSTTFGVKINSNRLNAAGALTVTYPAGANVPNYSPILYPGPAAALAIEGIRIGGAYTNSTGVVGSGMCTDIYALLLDQYGNAAAPLPSAPLSVALNATPSAGTVGFFSDSNCSQQITSIVFSAGTNFSQFYVMATAAFGLGLNPPTGSGIAPLTANIVASPVSAVGGSADLSVQGPFLASAGSCVSMEVVNNQGGPQPVYPALTVPIFAIDGSTPGIAAPNSFSDPACTIPSSSVAIPAGKYSAPFYIKGGVGVTDLYISWAPNPTPANVWINGFISWTQPVMSVLLR